MDTGAKYGLCPKGGIETIVENDNKQKDSSLANSFAAHIHAP